MQDIDERSITGLVIGQTSATADPRLQQIMASLVTHLHDFAREIQLTEAEWGQAIAFLTDVGHKTSATRQEFILLSDTLGLSMLVTAMNNVRPPGCTEATVLGPFHVDGAPEVALGADLANGAIGEPCYVSGRVLGLDGTPVSHARIEVWQADAEGFYDLQRDLAGAHRGRGTLTADADGQYYFRSVLAESYPIPHDGPVGKMLNALGRHPWRPAHLHFMITARGYQPLTTHVFREGDRYLHSDAVFGVRSSLVAPWHRHEAGERCPDGGVAEAVFHTLHFDFVLNPTEPRIG